MNRAQARASRTVENQIIDSTQILVARHELTNRTTS